MKEKEVEEENSAGEESEEKHENMGQRTVLANVDRPPSE